MVQSTIEMDKRDGLHARRMKGMRNGPRMYTRLPRILGAGEGEECRNAYFVKPIRGIGQKKST